MTASSIAVPSRDATAACPDLPSSTRPNFLRVLAAGQMPAHEALSPGRLSIGSSPRCTIRVAAPGVQPLHCTLQVDEQGAQCTSWGADVLLNGETFRSTSLETGDILQLGAVRLIAVGEPDDPIDPERMARCWAGPTIGRRVDGEPLTPPQLEQPVLLDGPTLDRRLFSDRLIYDLAQANQTARKRLRGCLGSLRATRQEAAELARSVADLENRLGESWKEQSQQRELCERLQQQAAKASEAAEALQQIEELSSQLGEVEAELATTQLQLAERTAANQSLEQRVDQLQSSLDRQGKTAERISALTERFREAQQLSERREEQLAGLHHEKLHLEASLTELQAQLREQQDRADRLADQLQEAESRDDEAVAAATERCRSLTEQAEQTQQRLAEVTAESERRAEDLEALRTQQRTWQSERLEMETRLAEQASRLAALVAEQAQASAEPDDRDEQLAAAAAEHRELQQQLEEHQAAAQASEQRLSELETQAEELRQQLAVAEEQLTAAETQLQEAESTAEKAVSELNEARQGDQVDAERVAEAVARVESLAEELQRAQSENERLAAEAEEARQQLEAARTLAAQQVVEPSPQVGLSETADAGRPEVEAPAERSLTPPTDKVETAEDVEEEASRSSEPTSFYEQYKHLLPNEDEPIESAAATPIVEEPSRPPLLSPTEDDDAESLEQYMAEMMQRVRTTAPAATASFAPTPPAPKPSPVRRETVAEKTADDEQESVEPIDLDQLRSSSQKPPMPTDMGALRSLANSAARKAIATSVQRRDLEIVASKLALCAIAVGASIYLMAASKRWDDPLSIAGGVLALAGGYAGFQFGARLVHIWKIRRAAAADAALIQAESTASDDRPTEQPAEVESTSVTPSA